MIIYFFFYPVILADTEEFVDLSIIHDIVITCAPTKFRNDRRKFSEIPSCLESFTHYNLRTKR